MVSSALLYKWRTAQQLSRAWASILDEVCLNLGGSVPQVVAGLDEGLLGMRTGGLRRLYVPGPLAFPKGLPSGPGRCAHTPPQSLTQPWTSLPRLWTLHPVRLYLLAAFLLRRS